MPHQRPYQKKQSLQRPAGRFKLEDGGSVWDSTNNGLEIIKSRISTFRDRFDILMEIRLSSVATLAGKIKEKCQV